jgi:hypothetical protein
LAQNKYVPLSSVYLDVAAKLENKNKKRERGRERKEDDEKENKITDTFVQL